MISRALPGKGKYVTVHGEAFSELKMPYDTVLAADFALVSH